VEVSFPVHITVPVLKWFHYTISIQDSNLKSRVDIL